MKGVGYVLFVVAPKVLFHSTLGVLLVACLSYMCIAIVAMMSKGGGQQGESYSLYMLISAAWFVPKMYESILANFASAIAAMWSILSRGYMKETWQCYIDLGTFIQEGSPSDERHDFWCMDVNTSGHKGTGWKYAEWEESFSCSLIILVWSKRVLVFWDNWLLKSVFAFAPWVVTVEFHKGGLYGKTNVNTLVCSALRKRDIWYVAAYASDFNLKSLARPLIRSRCDSVSVDVSGIVFD
jgi:hypothetical protein